MIDSIAYHWRGELTDSEMVELVESHGGNPRPAGGTASARTVSAG